MTSNFNVLLLNGPNLNLLGIREIKKYGNHSLSDVIKKLELLSSKLKIKLIHFQSNAESDLINCIHQNKNKINYIIINPGALAHTSISLRDALLSVNIPFIEIHITNIYKREKFRHHSYLSDISSGIICGLGIEGYLLALQVINKKLKSFINSNNTVKS